MIYGIGNNCIFLKLLSSSSSAFNILHAVCLFYLLLTHSFGHKLWYHSHATISHDTITSSWLPRSCNSLPGSYNLIDHSLRLKLKPDYSISFGLILSTILTTPIYTHVPAHFTSYVHATNVSCQPNISFPASDTCWFTISTAFSPHISCWIILCVLWSSNGVL